MLITLIIILVLIWAAVIWSIYWSFNVFYSNFTESENYHRAYYSSISALERWELVVRQREPWYIWSGGFILWNWLGGNPTNNDWWSDKELNGFSYFWNHKDITTVFRTINSRTNRIPKEWKWNIEQMLAADDSSGYNMLWYENSEFFLLYYDNSTWNPYTKWSINNASIDYVKWSIRLPQKLYDSGNGKFWLLDTSKQLAWTTWSVPTDEAIIDRQIKWTYDSYPFTIYSSQKTDRKTIITSQDTVFRESDVNWTDVSKWLEYNFWTSRNPIENSHSTHWDGNPKRIISQKEGEISTLYGFKNIFTNSNISKVQLRLSVLNFLKDVSSEIYPFLEYYAEFEDEVSDKDFTIDAEWNYSDYQVNLIIKKPTVKESVLSDFTSIF